MPLLDANQCSQWSGGAWIGSVPAGLRGVSIDSRTLQAGELFIALPGERVDGHSYVEAAFARGAAGAMVAAEWARTATPRGPLLAVEDPARGLTRMAAGHRGEHAGTFVGITGSVGKTTVKELLAGMLAELEPTHRTPGNWNNSIGLPLSLLQMEPSDRFGVFEIAMNHPGEIRELARLLRPHAAVMTPIGPAHLEAFPSVQAIAHEKADLLRELAATGRAVVWRQDAWFDVLREACPASLVTVSMEGDDAEYMGSGEEAAPYRLQILEAGSGERAEVQCPVPGAFFQLDVLLAAAMARTLGVNWEGIARAVSAFRPVGMRWKVENLDGVLFINDAYNANPISMAAALRTFAETRVAGRRWLALGTMRELGPRTREFHVELGARAAAVPQAVLVATGAWADAVAEGARGAGMPDECVRVFRELDGAAAYLKAHAAPGDAVLVKASRGDGLERLIRRWTDPAEADASMAH